MWWSETKRTRLSRRNLLRAAGGAALLALPGCGFQPLYARSETTGASTVDRLASVRVDPLSGRVGQLLHNFLRDRLNPQGQPAKPAYFLEVSLSESTEELAIRRDETATRVNLKLFATYVLKQAGEQSELFRGRSQTINSYNILQSQFATQVSEDDARKRGLRELSEDIKAQLAVFFSRSV